MNNSMVAPAPAVEVSVGDELAVTLLSASCSQQKTVAPNGHVETPVHVKTYTAGIQKTVPTMDAMGALLVKLQRMTGTHIVRGALVGWQGTPLLKLRRLLKAKRENGTEVPATIADAGRRWLFLDLDDLIATNPELDPHDVLACDKAAIARLPSEFSGVQHLVALTTKHGLPGKGARLRLVFLLDRPVTSRGLTAWLGQTGGGDASVFTPSQPIYTAPPIWLTGAPDPFPKRVFRIAEAAECVVVPEEAVRVPVEVERAPRVRVPMAELPDPEMEALSAMVRATPNGTAFDDRGAWIAYGHALASTFGEEAAELLFLDFSSRRDGCVRAGDAEDLWDNTILAADTHEASWTYLVDSAERGGVSLPAAAHRLRHVQRLAEACDEFAEFATEEMPADGLPPAPTSGEAVAVASSEDALALEFSRRHAGQSLYIANGRGWHLWAGHRWAQDDRKAVFDLSRLICRDHARRLEEEKECALARTVSKAGTRAAVLSIAASDPRHARSIQDFDADPWIMNTPGGVVDLRTGAIRPHRHGELVTKTTPVGPGGGCPTWLRFLAEATQGDAELVSYLQRWAGYSLTGSTVEQQFLFLYGPGGNGKSVIVQTLAAALGDYATTATPDVFTAVRNEQHLAHVAALKGARMVMAPETEEGSTWAEGRLKSLVAADRQSARFMRADPFEFTPELKLWICGNHLPRLMNVDDAMRRRTRIVHLTHRPATPDAFLMDKLRAELGGILAWCVQGCLGWQRSGLGMADAVRAACDEYFAEQDVFSVWIAERLDHTDANSSEGSRDLFSDWQEFAAARRERVRNETWFGAEMQKRFAREHTRTGKRFIGVRLLPRESEFSMLG